MYCFECGKQIPDYSKFCSFCGAKINASALQKTSTMTENSCIDHKKYEQSVRKGTLLYLRDVLSLEFSINKLQQKLKLTKDLITIHDYWFFWKCYDLQHPIERSDVWRYTKLVLSYSYRLNKYYYSFGENSDKISFYDYNGESVNHKYGQPMLALMPSVLDKKTRDRFCTVPILKNTFFSTVVVNEESTYWSFNDIRDNGFRLDGFEEVKSFVEHFERAVAKREATYQKQLPVLKKEILGIEKELAGAKKILNDLYNLNIIPAKYRNIGCAYFIYDFFSTSNTPLNNVFFHLDLDTIQSQLKQVINNQRDMILQQAVIIAQNEEIIAQNQQLFGELSSMNSNLGSINANLNSINESSIETAQWAKIAALNAEACAWFGWANYLK